MTLKVFKFCIENVYIIGRKSKRTLQEGTPVKCMHTNDEYKLKE